MKKFISVVLSLALVLTCAIPALAGSTTPAIVRSAPEDLGECEYPIIFVTGIGQTWTHLVNKDGSYKTDSDGNIIEYNLFYADFNNVLSNPFAILNLANLVTQLSLTIAFGENHVDQACVEKAVTDILRCNIIDEEGNLPSDVEDTVKKYPLSEYNDLDKKNFYRSIPCQSIVDQVGAENIFCYNYSAFSFLYRDADGLDDFIKTVLADYSDAEKVVLIPMSMGAAIVNAYLDSYGAQGDVAKVVSIVGAWDGSDVFADLISHTYAENAPDLVYNGVISDLIGEPWGYLVNTLIRVLPKATLREVLDVVLDGVMDCFVLKTPSLLALIPSARYEAIEEKYLMRDEYTYIREQTRQYYEAQSNLKNRMYALEADCGTEFYFLSGYGLEFGGYSSDYQFFQFFATSDTTNSDEIIQISSTSPGTTYAPAGSTLTKECYASDEAYASSQAKYVSPDGSIDVSTCYYPDRTWCFYQQKHELEYNNTAINLALRISLGNISSVAANEDVYPQFNESRDVKRVVRGDGSYINMLTNYIATNSADAEKADNVALAQTALDNCNAMLNNTHNDRDADDAVIKDTYDALVTIGCITPGDDTSSVTEDMANIMLKGLNDGVNAIFGSQGFQDFEHMEYLED